METNQRIVGNYRLRVSWGSRKGGRKGRREEEREEERTKGRYRGRKIEREGWDG